MHLVIQKISTIMECTFYLSEWEMSCLANVSPIVNVAWYRDLDRYVGHASRLFHFVKERPNFFSIKSCRIDYPTIMGMEKQTVLVFKKSMPDALDLIQCEPRFFKHCIQTPNLIKDVLNLIPDAILHIKNPTEEQKLAIIRLRPQYVLWFPNVKATHIEAAINSPNFCFKHMSKFGAVTHEISLAAVNENPSNLKWVPDQTLEICRAAVSKCSGAIKYVRDPSIREQLMRLV